VDAKPVQQILIETLRRALWPLAMSAGLAACGGGGDGPGGNGDPIAQVSAFEPAAAERISQPLPGVATSADSVVTAMNPGNGETLLAYTQLDETGVISVFARVLKADGTLGEQAMISLVNGLNAGRARVKYGPNGKAIAVWRQSIVGSAAKSDILARVYEDGRWGPITSIAKTALTFEVIDPDIAFDASGNAVVVWTEFAVNDSRLLRSATFVDQASQWAGPVTVSQFPLAAGIEEQLPRVAVIDSSVATGYLVVALQQGGANSGRLSAYRCTFPGTQACVPAGSSGALLPMPQGALAGKVETTFTLGSNAAGDVVVAWVHDYAQGGRKEVFMTSRSSGAAAGWRPPQHAAPQGVEPGGALIVRGPALHVASDGSAVLAWNQSSANAADSSGVFLKRFTATATGPMAPAPTVRVDTADADEVTLAVAPAGPALLLWAVPAAPGSTHLLSSAFDASASTLVPGSVARVDSAGAPDVFSVGAALGADGKGLAVWAETDSLAASGTTYRAMANRYE
jgi:hypothetical protein